MRKARYSIARARDFCARVAEGEPLDALCNDAGFKKAEVLDWLCDEADFRWRYARARELYADTLCDQVRQIADVKEPGADAGAGDLSQSAKQRIEIRKWLAARWTPKPGAADVGKERRSVEEPVIQVITGVPRSKHGRPGSVPEGA